MAAMSMTAGGLLHLRQVLLLVASAVATTMGLALIQTTPLFVIELGLLRGWETAPVALYMAMTAVSAWHAKRFAAWLGEAAHFSLSACLTAAGAALAYLAVRYGLHGLLAVSVVAIGLGLGTTQMYRFVGARAVAEAARGKILAAYTYSVLCAAIAAPSVGALAVSMNGANWPLSVCTLFFALAAVSVVLVLGLLPWDALASPRDLSAAGGGPLQPTDVRWATCAAVLGFLAGAIMTLLMTASPLHMKVCGVTPLQTAFTFQAHFLAMFAPSLVTGHLLDRAGLRACVSLGVLFNLMAAGVALSASSYTSFFWSLLFSGLGWNLLFLSSQYIVTNRMSEAGRAEFAGKSQAILTAGSGGAALLAAPLQSTLGWSTVAATALVLSLSVGMLAFVARGRSVAVHGT